MRSVAILFALLIAWCASAGNAVELRERLPVEASIASPAGSRAAEALVRHLTVQVRGKTVHAVQMIVRDPATGVFWTDVVRHTKPLDAPGIWQKWFAAYRFATNEKEIAAFHLNPLFIDASGSGRRASSLAEAEERTLVELVRDIESSWPVTDSDSKATPIRVGLADAFERSFLFDGEIHPTVISLTLESIAFEEGQWVVSIRNERNEIGRIFFSDAMKFLRAETRPKDPA